MLGRASHLACPICDASYTVGPQLYHLTCRPSRGTNSVCAQRHVIIRPHHKAERLRGLTFVRVSELYTFSLGSSAEARGGDQAGCCAEVDVVMCDAFLGDKNVGCFDVTRLEFERRTVLIRPRRNAGCGLGKTEII